MRHYTTKKRLSQSSTSFANQTKHRIFCAINWRIYLISISTV